jgi:spore germination protein
MIYVVETGDSLYSIAKEYNTTPASLTQVNELDNPDVLVVGQTIIIPGTPNPNRPTIDSNGYVEFYTETPSQTLLDEVKKRGPL